MWAKIRFKWERLIQLRIPLYVIISLIALLILLPTGEPTDFLTIPLIGYLGWKTVLGLAIFSGIVAFSNRKVSSFFTKPSQEEVERVCKKIANTKQKYKSCLVENR